MGRLWDLWLKQNPGKYKLPAVIPILFYHGMEKWSTGTQFQEIIDGAELAAEYVPKFSYILKDMSKFTDADIKGNITLKLFLHVIKHIFKPDFEEHFDLMLPLFVQLSLKETGMEYLETVLRYVYDVRDDIDPEETETKLIQVIIDEEKRGVL